MRGNSNGYLLSFFFLVFVASLLLGFQNCGIKKPGVEELSSMSVGMSSHSPLPASCSSCHDVIRPAADVPHSRFATGHVYFHADTYNGLSDCSSCHTQQVDLVGVSWKNGVYNHLNGAAQKVQTCSACHVADRPTGALPSGFNHNTATGALGDCAGCHINAGSSWSTSNFSHSPLPTSCNSCHNSARPSQTQYFPADKANPNFNLYVHATVYGGSGDCAVCHSSIPTNAGSNWMTNFYNHKDGANRNVTTCKDCHGKENPGIKGTMDHSQTTADCATCHLAVPTNVGVSWKGGQTVPATVTLKPPTGSNRTPLTIAHPTILTGVTCNSCHSNTAFNPVKGFDHSAMPNGTVCVYCHQSGQLNVSGVTIRTVSNGHHGANLNTQDCTACHKSIVYPTRQATTPVTWTGGRWD